MIWKYKLDGDITKYNNKNSRRGSNECRCSLELINNKNYNNNNVYIKILHTDTYRAGTMAPLVILRVKYNLRSGQ